MKKKSSLHVMKREEESFVEKERKKALEAIKNTPKVHVLAGLPQWLKEPESYPKVQRVLYETIATTHSHSNLLEWGSCVKCSIKLHEHGEMMRRLGFRSPAQYRAWVKVHKKIDARDKLR